MPPAFIDDGYTRDETIAAAKWHPEVQIVYRPMLSPERRRLTLQTVRLNARGTGGIDAASQLVIAAVAAKLVSWDLVDPAGGLREICPATVGALEPNLFEKIYAAVAGFDDPSCEPPRPQSSPLKPHVSVEEALSKN
jgi:hypothetical protein